MKISELTDAQKLHYFEVRLSPAPLRKSGRGYMALCCFHAERNPSLSISIDKGAWKCHGCGSSGGLIDFEKKFSSCDDHTAIAHIAEIVGSSQLMIGGRKPEAVYKYVDANGRDYFEVLRYPGKQFSQRKKNDQGGWDYKTSDLKMVLYHLDEVIGSNEVCVTEGEKDADNFRTAIKEYYVSLGKPPDRVAVTTSPRGAGKWQDHFAPYFTGKRVTIFQDNDEPGIKHAKRVAESVYRFANGVRIVAVPGAKDISEFMASGKTMKDVIQVVKDTPTWKPEASTSSLFVTVSEFEEKLADQIDWLVEGVIQRGANGLVIARPKAGKSFCVLDLAIAVASGQRWMEFFVPRRSKVALVSREDHYGLTQWREKKLRTHRGLLTAELDEWLYINAKGMKPKMMLDCPDEVAALVAELKRYQTEFLILDVMRVLHGSDENDNTEMQKVLDTLNGIQDKVGCSICLIHHDNKREESSLTERARGASAIAGYAEFICGIRVADEEEWVREFACELKAAMAPNKFHWKITDTEENAIKIERVEWTAPARGRKGKESNQEIPF
jgi:hypothetical protein